MLDRAAELRGIYDTLRKQLKAADGSAAAAIARELRILAAELEQLEAPEHGSKFDEVGAKRDAKAGASRPPARRRQSG